jgi:hypothetical protein
MIADTPLASIRMGGPTFICNFENPNLITRGDGVREHPPS